MTILHGKDADGESRPIKVAADGTVATSATVEPAEGGATEDKQDAQILLLGGGLPGALTGGGGVKVGLVDAIPAGANTIGAVTGPSAAALATETTLAALSAKLAAAQLISGTLTTPTTAPVLAIKAGYSSALGRPLVEPVDSTGIGSVIARKHAPSGSSRSTVLQVQRTIAGFSCTPTVVGAYSDTAGWIAFFNKASAVTNSDVPYGRHVYPIAAGGHILHEWEFRETFATGLVVAHLTQVTDGAGNVSIVLSITARCLFTGQYD